MSETNVIDIEKVQEEKHPHGWIITGICVSLLIAMLFTSFYGVFENAARKNLNSPLESEEQLVYLFDNSYVLYRELYNRQNQTNKNFAEIYLEPKEGYEWLLEEETMNMADVEFVSKLIGKDLTDDAAWDDVDAETRNKLFNDMYEFFDGYTSTIEYVKNYFYSLENQFGELNSLYDYIIEDTVTGEYVTNLTNPDVDSEEQFLCLSFVFDENGNVSLSDNIKGNDVTKLRKSANEAMRIHNLANIVENREIIKSGYIKTSMPKNCKVTYCISNLDWSKLENSGIYAVNAYGMDRHSAYYQTACVPIYLLFLLLVCLAGLLCPGLKEAKPWKREKVCRCMPAEGLFMFAYIIVGMGNVMLYLVMWVNGGNSVDSFTVFMPRIFAKGFVYGLNILIFAVFMFAAWYIGICLRALKELGIKEYIKERSFFYQIFPYAKSKYLELYEEASRFDVTKNAKKLICKIVIANGIILFIIGCLPLGGLAIAIVYSVILYFILKRYISDLQKKYGILLNATNEIAEGNLNGTITQNLGVFEPFKPQVARIQEGFKKAVEAEVKSQRMKSELITNVSHDLKTPLTAIITYINLLKEENINEEQRKEYLGTLERKSLRLKVLIEDLFEVSKANSQNLTLNIMDVDIVNLLKQVAFEMDDKLKESKLDVRMELPTEKIVLPLDSQKTYRIFENLLGNVAKYALTGTRVYIQCGITDEEISIAVKNISTEEIKVSAEELTERFVRGDVSRNTEGSGLGLAIAKSFTELQGGIFKLDLDGDLFKVSVTFPRKHDTLK